MSSLAKPLALLVTIGLIAVTIHWWRHPVDRLRVTPVTTPVRVDVNVADVATLSSLPGIGYGLARRIIERRQSHGIYRGLDDLEAVPGVGPMTLRLIQRHVAFGPVVGPWIAPEELSPPQPVAPTPAATMPSGESEEGAGEWSEPEDQP